MEKSESKRRLYNLDIHSNKKPEINLTSTGLTTLNANSTSNLNTNPNTSSIMSNKRFKTKEKRKLELVLTKDLLLTIKFISNFYFKY